MAPTKTSIETVELLLAAMSRKSGNGLRSSFMFGRPGVGLWDRNLGAEVYFDFQGLIVAALHIRQHGHQYLRYVAVRDVARMLQEFVTDNFWYLSEVFFARGDEHLYGRLASGETKAALASELDRSPLVRPESELTVYPLVPVRMEADFDSPTFFLTRPEGLNASRLPLGISAARINAVTFPPLSEWEGTRAFPTSWLGVRSPAYEASNKIKRSVLGALALTPLPGQRHLFSLRSIFGGRCTIGKTAETTFGEPHTPALMHDIVLSERDHAWLNVLAQKLGSAEKAHRREMRSLEYYYRAWELEPSERFPILCMALDAVFGDASHATQALISGIRGLLGNHIQEPRLRALVELRASVIHGGAPDVYDSRKYARYYREYNDDPIGDLELITAKCLQMQIFGLEMQNQSDPNAATIAQLRAKGIIPKEGRGRSILGS